MKLLICLSLVAVAIAAETYRRPHVRAPPPYQSAVPIANDNYQPAAPQRAYQPEAAPQKAYQPEAAPVKEDYGPDTSNFQYQVPIYDAKTYGNADVNVNRFPGGANYQINESSKGSDVKVSFEHSVSNKQNHRAPY